MSGVRQINPPCVNHRLLNAFDLSTKELLKTLSLDGSSPLTGMALDGTTLHAMNSWNNLRR